MAQHRDTNILARVAQYLRLVILKSSELKLKIDILSAVAKDELLSPDPHLGGTG